MIRLPAKESSLWMASAVAPAYPTLQESIEVDDVIIGGGIAGLTSAYLLKQAGRKVAVLEQGKVGSGTTGHTTGKVTSSHNVTYQRLVERFGTKYAQIYGHANETAIKLIEKIVEAENIDCNWERADNYIYTEKPEEVQMLYREAHVANKLGLPATFEKEIPELPLWIEGAVKFKNQAKIHSQKYLLALAKTVHGKGSFVFEQTKAKKVHEGKKIYVKANKSVVNAKNIIIATNVPFPLVAHGLYCALEYPQKSYIIAVKTKLELPGMFITPGRPLTSLLPIKHEGEKLLLVGGESHILGLAGNTQRRYQHLADYAELRLAATEVIHYWSARDYLAYDSVPLIGKLYPWSKHTYVATAFMKWGLTSATVAGMLLSDTILGKTNSWDYVFNSNRISPVKAIPYVFAKHVGLIH
jgi:glycine/D-amino acid oxidase-like deaminating enzyme